MKSEIIKNKSIGVILPKKKTENQHGRNKSGHEVTVTVKTPLKMAISTLE